jgi:Cof subfamily protein (haloacid dehalogenase superfamily)
MSPRQDIRLLITDVDGTLVNHDKVLSEAAKDAARALRAAGIELALSSARPPFGVRMLVEPLSIDLPIAGFNGGVFANPDLSVIERHAIAPDAARKSVRFLAEQGLDVWLYTEDAWIVPGKDAPHVARETFILRRDPKIADRFTDDELDNAFKIVGVSDDHALIAKAETATQDILGDTASATRSEPHFIDVTNPKANKGAVVHTMAARLGLKPEQIATIGDGQNDILMFRESGFSIAMGNASDDVKAAADAVADSNETDGWAKAVRRFLLQAEAA